MSDTAGNNTGLGSVSSKQAGAAPLTVFAAPTTGDEINTLGERLVPKACFKVEDLLFDFGSSFIRPEMKGHLPQLAQLREDNKEQNVFPPLSIFGHADPEGDDDFNKVLSGRRAIAFYAMLVRDVDLWERLFTNSVLDDNWGTRSIQTMLSTVQDPITVDGKPGDETSTAIRTFQKSHGLGVDGTAGSSTRKVLFLAYMDALCGPDLKLDKTTDFLARNKDGAGGKGDFQGCSEFNPLRVFSKSEEAAFERAADKTKRNEDNAPNRRVVALLFAPGRKVNPGSWPCPRASEGVAACKKRFFPDAEVRRNPQAERREFDNTKDTFACRFYQILSDDSPCERVNPLPPIPVLGAVNPILFFPNPDEAPVAASNAPVAASDKAALVSSPPAAGAAPGAAAPVGAAGVTPATRVVVVKKPHTKAARVDVDLTTDKPFDGRGTFTISPKGKIDFFLGTKKLLFDNKDNVFTGDELRVGVTLFAEGVSASTNLDDVTLTLTLSGGSKVPGPPAKVKMTAVEVTLDICDPRTSPTTDPPALAQPPATAPAAGAAAKDKIFGGRGLPEQNEAKTSERAILIVRQIKPSTFNGKLVLTALTDSVKAFTTELPVKDETALIKRHVFPAADVKAADKKFFAEGVTVSTAVRDTGFQLGVEGLQEDADRVAITVVHAEIVSNADPNDVRIIARVPEKPERKTKSKFFPAPIIIGVAYDVQLRPHLEIPQPAGPFKPPKFLWSTPAAAQLTLADTAKEIVKLKAKKVSAKLDDITIDLIVDSDIGKFKISHKLTIVIVEIDPVTSGDTLTAASAINFIINPSVTPILLGAAAAAATAPKIEFTKKVQPDLAFTDDDDRIAWWIIGGETAGKDKYQGKAVFLSDENSQRGTKIQIAGSAIGDILVQPYSGGFGYGMFRTNVNAIHKIKYRVNRIFTALVPPVLPTPGHPGKPGIPAHVPTRSHADAKRHIAVCNVYLRQMGLELIPDDSAEMASSGANPKVGLASLDSKVVAVTQVENGHFDVRVNDRALTFRASDGGGDRAVQINARNEIVVFAYIESLASGNNVLAQAQLWPVNHAPGRVLKDKGVPSSSLISKTGIPGSTPVSEVRMVVLAAPFVRPQPLSPATRDKNLLWGISVPTTSIDNNAGGVNVDMAYGSTLGHELGHVLGLNHRIAGGDPFADGITIPRQKNLMFPSAAQAAENFDIIQAKAVRLSEVLARNP